MALIFDSDDLTEDSDLGPLHALKQANPAFKLTCFAIPTRCSREFTGGLPDWIEVAWHGWEHGDPPTDGGECKEWTRAQMADVLLALEARDQGERLFKAPGWQLSDDCYQALAGFDWMLADQPYNDERRPRGLATHRLGDGDPHIHTHLTDVCGNGLAERYDEWEALVRAATEFRFVSEACVPW